MGWAGGGREAAALISSLSSTPLHYFHTTVRVIFLDINHKIGLLRR